MKPVFKETFLGFKKMSLSSAFVRGWHKSLLEEEIEFKWESSCTLKTHIIGNIFCMIQAFVWKWCQNKGLSNNNSSFFCDLTHSLRLHWEQNVLQVLVWDKRQRK